MKFPWNHILNSCGHKFPKAHLEQPHEEVDKKMQSVNTVAENQSHCGTEQCEQAKRAWQLLKSLGLPTFEKLKLLNHTNWIDDDPVVTADVKIAEDIWGKDTAASKG